MFPIRQPNKPEEGKGDLGGAAPPTPTAEQLQAALAAIDAFKEQADDYLQQAGALQMRIALERLGIEIRGAVNLVRIAVARGDALAAIERARSDALSQVQNTTMNRQGTNPTMNG